MVPFGSLGGMHKFMRVYEALGKRKRDRFCRWLEAQAGRGHDHLNHLRSICDACLEAGRPLDPPLAWKELFPEKPYHNIAFNREMTDMVRHVEDFLAYEVFCKNTAARKMAVIEAYQDLGLLDLGNTLVQQSKAQLESQPQRDVAHYESAYRLSQWDFTLAITLRPQERYAITEDICRNLNAYFALEHLRVRGLVAQMEMISPSHPAIDLLARNGIGRAIKADAVLSNLPVVQFYLQLQHLFSPKGNKGKIILALAARLEKVEIPMGAILAKEHFRMLLSRGVNLYNQSETQFTAVKLWSLYEIGARKGWLLNNGVLSETNYRSMAKLALYGLSDATSFDSFLRKYALHHKIESTTAAEATALAELYFMRKAGKHRELVIAAKQVFFRNISYKIEARIMHIQARLDCGDHLGDVDAQITLRRAHAYASRLLDKNKTIGENKKVFFRQQLTVLSKIISARTETQWNYIAESIPSITQRLSRIWYEDFVGTAISAQSSNA